ncbi:MAG: tetratricopeptide repeat protein [Sandaracinaceae bacterium]|nr:tetratricopeptide repeat protein [Sandaracinaceae bacterium]
MTLANNEPTSPLPGVLLLGVLLALAVPATAHAQRRDDEARALYSAGEIAFSEGRYEYALVHFQRAYELSPRPILLFNIGASAERLSRDTLALEAYEQYLQELPDAPNRRVVAARIVLLRQALYGQPEPSLETDEPTGAGPWIVVGVGAAAVALGAVFTGLGFADAATVRDLPDGTPWAAVADEYERAPRRQMAGFALLGVGTVAVVTGVVLAIRGSRNSPSDASASDSTRVTGWVDQHSAGVVASGSF